MRVQIKKWGNSASVRIPASVMSAANLKIDQAVEITEDNGKIVLVPVKTPVYDLDEMIQQMDPDTFHDEIDFGSPGGKEVW